MPRAPNPREDFAGSHLMIEAAETIQYLIAGRMRERFESDVGLQLALVPALLAQLRNLI